MQISVAGHHVEVTEAMQEHVREKLAKADKFFDRITSARVVFSKDGPKHTVELVVNACRGHTLVSEADGSDMYAAIDKAVDRLARQITREKEKMRDKRAGQKRELPETDEGPDDAGPDDDEDQTYEQVLEELSE